MTRITITDVYLRDGLQDEEVVVPTSEKLRLAQALAEVGVPRIETASFVNPVRVPQMGDAANVVSGLADLQADQTVLALNGRGIRRAVEAGATDVNLIVSASEAHSKANAGRGWREALDDLAATLRELEAEGVEVRVHAGISTAFVCPFEGDIDPERVAEIAVRWVELGALDIGLADTLGVASTEAVLATVAVVRNRIGDVPISLHLHNAKSQAIDTAIAAARAGITRFDAAIAGFGGCPFAPGAHGNVATEELVAAFHDAGFDTGIDLARLRELADDARRVVAEAPALPDSTQTTTAA